MAVLLAERHLLFIGSARRPLIVRCYLGKWFDDNENYGSDEKKHRNFVKYTEKYVSFGAAIVTQLLHVVRTGKMVAN